MKLVHVAQYEISIDGVPRSHRDRKELALQSARFLKSRNPNRRSQKQLGEMLFAENSRTRNRRQFYRRHSAYTKSIAGTQN
jgi:hypothetical protein